MSVSPVVRTLSVDDLPGCAALCRTIGWPWEAPKWELLLSKGEGFAIDAPDGSLVGTVVLNRFADKLASVGLMGVAPAWGRRGMGRALMERALERAGTVPTFLYATAKGQGLYAQLGFQVAGGSARWVGRRTARPTSVSLGSRRLRRLERGDLAAVTALDAVAFGAPRPAYLEALWRLADEARVAEDGERLVGFGLAWTLGARRTVGPIIAPDAAVAMALLEELSESRGASLRVDIPDALTDLAACARNLGLTRDSPAPLMVRNAPCLPGRREWLYALAMPGLG